MKNFISLFSVLLCLIVNAHCDTIPGRWSTQKQEFRTDWSEIKPDEQHLSETPGYNQALVGVGFLSVIIVVGGFVFILTKKKHS